MPEIAAHMPGRVWRIECEVGDAIAAGDAVVILESMKMELPVQAGGPGVVGELLCEEGQSVNEGDTLIILR